MDRLEQEVQRELGVRVPPVDPQRLIEELHRACPEAELELGADGVEQIVHVVAEGTRVGKLAIADAVAAELEVEVGDALSFGLMAYLPEPARRALVGSKIRDECRRYCNQEAMVAALRGPRAVPSLPVPFPYPLFDRSSGARLWKGIVAGRSLTVPWDTAMPRRTEDVGPAVTAWLDDHARRTGIPLGGVELGLTTYVFGAYVAGWTRSEPLPLHTANWRALLQRVVGALEEPFWRGLAERMDPRHRACWGQPQARLVLVGNDVRLLDGTIEVGPRWPGEDWPALRSQPDGFVRRNVGWIDGIVVRGREVARVPEGDLVEPLDLDRLESFDRLTLVDRVTPGSRNTRRCRLPLHAHSGGVQRSAPFWVRAGLPRELRGALERLEQRRQGPLSNRRQALTALLRDAEALERFIDPVGWAARRYSPPATEAARRDLVARGAPAELDAIYAWHDGQDRSSGIVADGLDGWALKSISECLQFVEDCSGRDDFEDSWFPFADEQAYRTLIVDLAEGRHYGKTACWAYIEDDRDLEFDVSLAEVLDSHFRCVIDLASTSLRARWVPEGLPRSVIEIDPECLHWTDPRQLRSGATLLFQLDGAHEVWVHLLGPQGRPRWFRGWSKESLDDAMRRLVDKLKRRPWCSIPGVFTHEQLTEHTLRGSIIHDNVKERLPQGWFGYANLIESAGNERGGEDRG